jgi:homogentisate 1,2-dioxygenase
MKFTIEIDGQSRGYVLEVYDNHFILPNLGLIGSNGLADSRHFLAPVAHFDNDKLNIDFKIVNKFQGKLFEAKQVNFKIKPKNLRTICLFLLQRIIHALTLLLGTVIMFLINMT